VILSGSFLGYWVELRIIPPPSSRGGFMLYTLLKSPVTRQRLRSGPATQHVDAFAEWLHPSYRPVTIDTTLRSLAGCDVSTTEIYLRLDPSEKLEAEEAVRRPLCVVGGSRALTR
jgi:hypothetical protein